MGNLFLSFSGCTDSDGVATLNCLTIVVHNIIVLFMAGAAIATLFMLIMAGIKFSLSGGDSNRVQAARSSITYAIIGVAIVFLAFVILQLISHVTGNSDVVNSNLNFVKPTN